MRRNLYPETTQERQLPEGNRGDIIDVTGELFNTSIKVENISSIIHSLPSVYAPVYIYKNSCNVNYPNNELLFSQLLDLLELFFTRNNLPFEVSVDSTIELENIKEETKNHFLNALKKLSPYGNNNRIQLVKVKSNGKEEIIGGTSPYTIFFLSASLRDTQFFKDYPEYFRTKKELKDRDPEFLGFLLHLSNLLKQSIGDNVEHDLNGFRRRLKDLLDQCSDINKLDESILENEKAFYRINAIELFSRKKLAQLDSPYVIKPSINRKFSEGKVLPLVLKSGLSGKYYSTKIFPENFGIEGNGGNTLPMADLKYPWINPLKDFLEDYIVQTSTSLNNEWFKFGDKSFKDTGFLLPLKPLFFEYFSIADFDKLFEIKVNSSGNEWEVFLTIPINDVSIGELKFKKVFTKNDREIKDGIGKVIQLKNDEFPTFSIWPSIEEKYLDRYYLTLYSKEKLKIELYNENENISPVEFTQTTPDDFFNILSTEPRTADILSFGFSRDNIDIGGLLVQNKSLYQKVDFNNEKAVLGIDFGTTYATVALNKKGDNRTHPSFIWNYNDEENLYFNSFNTEDYSDLIQTYSGMLNTYFIPLQILKELKELDAVKENNVAQIPFPTLVSSKIKKQISFEHSEMFVDYNIPFCYKSGNPKEYRITSEFKWGQDVELMKVYLRELLVILKFHLMMNSISSKNVTLRISYPLIFSATLRQNLKKAWTELQDENEFQKTEFVSESIAVLEYFQVMENYPIRSDPYDSIIIDIGGGTTDVCIFNADDKILSSDSLLIGGRDIVGWFGQSTEFNEILNPIVKYLAGKTDLSKLDEFKGFEKSQLQFGYLFSDNQFIDKFNKSIINEDRFDFSRLIVSYFFMGIIYFLGVYRKNEIFKKPVSGFYFGGNSSRFLDWLAKGEWNNSEIKNEINKSFVSFYLAGLGKNENNESIKFIKSLEPKFEVALGLLKTTTSSSDENPSQENTNEVVELTKSQRLTIFGDHIKVDDQKFNPTKILQSEHSAFGDIAFKYENQKIDFEDFKKSEIYNYNQMFFEFVSNSQLFNLSNPDAILNTQFMKELKVVLTDGHNYSMSLIEEIKRHVEDTGQYLGSSFFILSLKGFLHQIIKVMNNYAKQ